MPPVRPCRGNPGCPPHPGSSRLRRSAARCCRSQRCRRPGRPAPAAPTATAFPGAGAARAGVRPAAARPPAVHPPRARRAGSAATTAGWCRARCRPAPRRARKRSVAHCRHGAGAGAGTPGFSSVAICDSCSGACSDKHHTRRYRAMTCRGAPHQFPSPAPIGTPGDALPHCTTRNLASSLRHGTDPYRACPPPSGDAP